MEFVISETEDRKLLVHHVDQYGVLINSEEMLIQAGEGLPASSTDNPLIDCADDEVLQLRDGQWQPLKNYVGRMAYSVDRNESKNFVIDFYGELPVSHSLIEPKIFDSWVDGKWQHDAERERKHIIKVESDWQKATLAVVERALVSAESDMKVPKEFDSLRVYTEGEYHSLLIDRKNLFDYLKNPDFPNCDRPEISDVSTSKQAAQ